MNLAKGTVVSKLADIVVLGDRNENKTKEIVLFENEGSRLALMLGTYWTILTVTLQISKFFFLSFLILFITAVLLSVLFYLSLPISFLPTFSDRYSASSSLSRSEDSGVDHSVTEFPASSIMVGPLSIPLRG